MNAAQVLTHSSFAPINYIFVNVVWEQLNYWFMDVKSVFIIFFEYIISHILPGGRKQSDISPALR